MMVNPQSVMSPLSSKFSAFNPRYVKNIEKKLAKILSCDPLPLIKIISNHDFSMVDKMLANKYITVFIEPHNLRKQVLKVLVAKKTDTFVNKEDRLKYKGEVLITAEEIRERFDYYSQHMTYKDKCDYHFTDNFVVNNPEKVQQTLGLPVMTSKYEYTPFEISDEEMVKNINDFHRLYDKISMEYFGEIK
jgi:hypothetical protein